MLGAHVNAALRGLDETLQRWKPPLVVVLDHSDVWRRVKARSPNTVFVGRIVQRYEPDFNDAALDPVRAAAQHCELLLPTAARMGETYGFWQGVNEPVIQSPEAMRRYAEFEVERVRILDRHGFRTVVGSFGVGNPPDLALWKYFLPALEAARQHKGVLGLHEYAWPSLDRDAPWYLLRHRKVYAGEPKHSWAGLPEHLRRLPLLITECGLDGLIERPDPCGWKALFGQDPSRYLQQLAWYDAELRKDPYVVGAALYCCCSADDAHWASYNVWPEVVQALAEQARPIYRLEQLLKPIEPPAPAPGAQPGRAPLPVPEAPVEPEPAAPAAKPAEAPAPLPKPVRYDPRGAGNRRILSDATRGTVPAPSQVQLPQAADDLLALVLKQLDAIQSLLKRLDGALTDADRAEPEP